MTREHIVKSFDEDLKHIETLIMEMGGIVEKQIADAADALTRRDTALAEIVIKSDKRIDELEAQVDQDVVRVLAQRQPLAQDLRAVVVAPKIASNLERIGDYAKNIAKRTSVLAKTQPIGSSAQTIKRMCAMVQEMVQDVLEAYVRRDANTADDVRRRDEEVDQMHNTLFRELLTYMMEDHRAITPCMHLLFIAKNVERMGDHTTSIAEQVHYMVSGEIFDEERPKRDMTSTTLIEPDAAE
ncbi:MAG: phosphate transport system regulatory protein PhoU [Alphaproteobacteria bacterium]|nr:MAG: phosphate transport system regulatory protein PhoU [Alphaproteobacteria bacterium]